MRSLATPRGRANRLGVNDKLQALLSPALAKGESVPNAGLLLVLFARCLDRAADELDAADNAHTDELADDAEPRRRRDEASEELFTVLLEVKRTLQPRASLEACPAAVAFLSHI